MDVRDLEALTSVLEPTIAEYGQHDIVCADAGIATYASTADQRLSARQWQDLTDVNLTGEWNTCTAAIPHLAHGGATS